MNKEENSVSLFPNKYGLAGIGMQKICIYNSFGWKENNDF